MSFTTIITSILILIASVLAFFCLFKLKWTNVEQTGVSTSNSTSKHPFIGFSYNVTSIRSAALLAKLQSLMSVVQTSTCNFVKPAWANMKPTLMASGAAVQGTSCASQKQAIIQIMQKAQVDNSAATDSIKIPLPDDELDRIRTAIVELLTQVLDETCVNDKPDVSRATGLIDDIVAAFCA